MQRCISLFEIGHCFRLILNEVVNAAWDNACCDMSASVRSEPFGNLRDQLRKRRCVSRTEEQRHVIRTALRNVELRVGWKRAVHFKHCVQLRISAVSLQVMGNLVRCEFSELEEIPQVGGLPPVDKFLGESR